MSTYFTVLQVLESTLGFCRGEGAGVLPYGCSGEGGCLQPASSANRWRDYQALPASSTETAFPELSAGFAVDRLNAYRL